MRVTSSLFQLIFFWEDLCYVKKKEFRKGNMLCGKMKEVRRGTFFFFSL